MTQYLDSTHELIVENDEKFHRVTCTNEGVIKYTELKLQYEEDIKLLGFLRKDIVIYNSENHQLVIEDIKQNKVLSSHTISGGIYTFYNGKVYNISFETQDSCALDVYNEKGKITSLNIHHEYYIDDTHIYNITMTGDYIFFSYSHSMYRLDIANEKIEKVIEVYYAISYIYQNLLVVTSYRGEDIFLVECDTMKIIDKKSTYNLEAFSSYENRFCIFDEEKTDFYEIVDNKIQFIRTIKYLGGPSNIRFISKNRILLTWKHVYRYYEIDSGKLLSSHNMFLDPDITILLGYNKFIVSGALILNNSGSKKYNTSFFTIDNDNKIHHTGRNIEQIFQYIVYEVHNTKIIKIPLVNRNINNLINSFV